MAVVITGDIISSSKIAEPIRQQRINQVIEGLFSKFREAWKDEDSLRAEAIQGDSFQILLSQDADGVRAALIARSFCLAQNIEQDKYRFNCRLSIGRGSISLLHPNSLATSGGTAFEYSGRNLKEITPDGPQIHFTSDERAFDSAMMMGLTLAEALISRWTTAQSEAVLVRLLYPSRNQEWLAGQLHITRSAYWQRLRQISWPSFEALLSYYAATVTKTL